MIPLTKDTIDNIFEPRRLIRTVQELEAAAGRLLTDGHGRYFSISRESLIDEDGKRYRGYQYKRTSRPQPDFTLEWGQPKYKKGTYPVWVTDERTTHDATLRPCDDLPCWECLPAPVHQVDILLALYRIAFPDYDRIVKMESWPTLSQTTWTYICEKFMAFDRKMHPDVLAGGMWSLGSGFSGHGKGVLDWCIDTSTCKVVYQDAPFWFTIRRSDYGDQNEYSSFYPSIVWDGEVQDPVDQDNRRVNSLEEAKALCEKRAGGPLVWGGINPGKWDGMLQSCVIRPEVARAA